MTAINLPSPATPKTRNLSTCLFFPRAEETDKLDRGYTSSSPQRVLNMRTGRRKTDSTWIKHYLAVRANLEAAHRPFERAGHPCSRGRIEKQQDAFAWRISFLRFP